MNGLRKGKKLLTFCVYESHPCIVFYFIYARKTHVKVTRQWKSTLKRVFVKWVRWRFLPGPISRNLLMTPKILFLIRTYMTFCLQRTTDDEFRLFCQQVGWQCNRRQNRRQKNTFFEKIAKRRKSSIKDNFKKIRC